MPTDNASIYSAIPGPAPSTPPNLLGMVGQVANAQNAINQNTLFQQMFAARNALGGIIAHNTGPDGATNWNGVTLGMSAHPDLVPFQHELLPQVLQSKNLDLDATTKQISQSQQHFKNAADVFSGLLSKAHAGLSDSTKDGRPINDSLSQKDLAGAVASIHANFPMTPEKQMEFLGKVGFDVDPKTGLSSGQYNGKTAYNFMKQYTQASAGAADAQNRALGVLQITRGGVQELVQPNAPAGRVTTMAGGTFPQLPTSAEASALVASQLPVTAGARAGETVMTPAAQVPGLLQPGGMPSGGPSGGPGGSPGGSLGPPPVSPTQGGPLSGGASLGATPRPTLQLTKELGPVQKQGLANVATYEKSLDDRAKTAANMQNFLRESQQLIQDASGKQFTPNVAQSFRARLGALASAAGADDKVSQAIAGGNIGNVYAFQKLAVQAATMFMKQSFEGMPGPRAAIEWSKYQSVFPGADTPLPAIKSMYDYINHQSDLIKWEQEYYNKYGKAPGSDITQWQSRWNRQLDDLRDAWWADKVGTDKTEKLFPTPKAK